MALFGPCVVCVSGVPEDPEYRCVHTFHRANYGYYKQLVCSSCMENVESSWGSEPSSAWWSTEDEMTDNEAADSDEPEAYFCEPEQTDCSQLQS